MEESNIDKYIRFLQANATIHQHEREDIAKMLIDYKLLHGACKSWGSDKEILYALSLIEDFK